MNWRTCAMQTLIVAQDSRSRNENARFAQLSAQAGFSAPSNAALAKASAAEGRSTLAFTQSQCDLTVKALVALTALPEPDVRQRLVNRALPAGITAAMLGDVANSWPLTSATIALLRLPQPQTIAIQSLPGQVIAQRPDVFNAEREVMATRSEVWAADILKQPQITFTGNIGVIDVLSRGVNSGANTWAIGPITVNLPIWDWGRYDANLAAAKARYDDAVSSYLGKVRNAVKEVEQALINLQSSGERTDDAITAATGYLAAVQAAQARYSAGLGSLSELEETRRVALQAELALLNLQLGRVNDWIALYRAAGGGWQRPATDTPAGANTNANLSGSAAAWARPALAP
jgi:outer membrane protein TolC